MPLNNLREGSSTGLKTGGLNNIGTSVSGFLLTINDTYAIPSSGDLHAHFDASDKSSVDPWPNEVAEADLSTSGSPTVQTNDKNGLNTVLYDGADDYHATDWNSALSQPHHIFIVFTADTSKDAFLLGGQGPNGTGRADFRVRTDSNNDYQIDGGNNLLGGNADQNWHIANILIDGTNSKLDIDQSNAISGDAGTSNQDGLSIGELLRSTGFHFNGRVGEYLGYNTDKSAIESDIETYLNDKWAVF